MPRGVRVLGALLCSCAVLLVCPPARAHEPAEEGLVRLTRELERAPQDAALYLRRARLQLKLGNPRAALADLDRATRLDPGSAPIARGRAAALLETGRVEEALGLTAGLVGDDAAEPESWLLRGRALAAAGRRLEAAEAVREAIARMASPSAEHFVLEAGLLASAGCGDAALKAVEGGLSRLGPAVALESAALDLELRLGRRGAAIARLDRLVSTSGRAPPWLARRAEVLEAVGMRLEAQAAWTEVLEAIAARPAARRDAPALAALASRARAALEAGR